MPEIKLFPQEANFKIFSFLEKEGLIRLFKPSKRALNYKREGCLVEKIYSSSPRFGTHRLIRVTLNTNNIRLNSHPENEEFILIDIGHNFFKPLYLVLSLYKHKELEKKIRMKKIESKDFIALRLKYNHPQVSVFTLIRDTVHCEVTEDGQGRAPIFFVTEPSKITSRELDLSDYNLILTKR